MGRIKRMFFLIKDNLRCKCAQFKLHRLYSKCYKVMEMQVKTNIFGRCGGLIMDDGKLSKVCSNCPYHINQYQDKLCYKCQKHHSMDCPPSDLCYSTITKPYFKPKE